MRRRRDLTAEEWRLWRAVAATAKPLPGRPVAEPLGPGPNPAAPAARDPHDADLAIPPPPAPPPLKARPQAGHGPRPRALADLDGAIARRARRGALTIDGRLDLHGHRESEAHRALHRFVQAARGRGDRVLLVITGKGRGEGASPVDAGSEGGRLRRLVPLWLAEAGLAPLIAGLGPAHPRHGGSGALYVYLRRGSPGPTRD